MQFFRITLFILFLVLTSCSKEKNIEVIEEKEINLQMIDAYQEGMKFLNDGDGLTAAKKFSEAEGMLPDIDWASKSALMSSYCLYNINFYDQDILNLERFIRIYPASQYVSYAHYLIAISYYEQILDEDKDIQPLLISKKKIEDYLKKFPNTDYAIDLKFKLDLVINQLAAKELLIARYYIKNEKWIPAINRLKIIVKTYDKTIFVEEALHRLVEINYKIGLNEEAKAAAVLLGYIYNSSEWYKRSYQVLNKNYKIPTNEEIKTKKNEEDGLIKRTIKKILG